jgi:hypothetical protein
VRAAQVAAIGPMAEQQRNVFLTFFERCGHGISESPIERFNPDQIVA